MPRSAFVTDVLFAIDPVRERYTHYDNVACALWFLEAWHAQRHWNAPLLVAAEKRTIKTLVQALCAVDPIVVCPDGSPSAPVIVVRITKRVTTETAFWSMMLWTIGICHNCAMPSDRKKRMALDTLAYAKAQTLVLVNLHNTGADASRIIEALSTRYTCVVAQAQKARASFTHPLPPIGSSATTTQ
jgi:hypothetical protein